MKNFPAIFNANILCFDGYLFGNEAVILKMLMNGTKVFVMVLPFTIQKTDTIL